MDTALHTRGPPGHPRAHVSCQASPASRFSPVRGTAPPTVSVPTTTRHPLLPELKGHPQGGFPRINVQVEKSACPETMERPWGNPCDAQLGECAQGRPRKSEDGACLGPGPVVRMPPALPGSACGGHGDPAASSRVRSKLLPPCGRHLRPAMQPGHPALSGHLSSLQPRPHSGAPDPLPVSTPSPAACTQASTISSTCRSGNSGADRGSADPRERPESVLVSIGTKQEPRRSPKAGATPKSGQPRPTHRLVRRERQSTHA